MTATLLDGKACAAVVKADLAARVVKLGAAGITPGLGTVLVGEDPGSVKYVAGKHRDCAEVGITSIRRDLPADASEGEILAAIRELNESDECTGYIVQLPLPTGVDTNRILEAIDPDKDADGLHPMNLGRLALRVNEEITSPLPCTPSGILELARRNNLSFANRDVAVIGRGTTVGRSIGLLLTRKDVNATVTLMHTGTRDIAEKVSRADVVVAAAGSAHMVRLDWVKPGAIVFDVGVSRTVIDGASRIAGDVDPAVAEVAGYLSPNPGGVGPMTRAMLLANVVSMAERKA